MARRRAHYRGHVQGVGFRATARAIARRHAVTGYVRNLPDGRVEIVADGEPDAVDGFLAAVREQMAPLIDDARDEPIDGGGESFDGFEVRR